MLLACGIAFYSVLLVGDCFTKFPNLDELAHLPAGVSHVKFSKFDLYRVNPPLVRTFCAAFGGSADIYDWSRYSDQVGYRAEFELGINARNERKLELIKYYVGPRLASLAFWLAGGLFLSLFVRAAISPICGIIACWFWIASPNILSNAASVGPDLGSVSLGILTVFAAWYYVHRPGVGTSFYAGAAFGVALLTKLTWLTAVVTIPATVAMTAWLLVAHLPRRAWVRRGGDLLIFWAVSLLVLNAGYLFQNTFVPLGEYEFCSETLGGDGCDTVTHGNRFSDTLLASVPVPVPRDYVLGIDYLKHEVEETKSSFLMGEWKYGSWSYYYVMTTLFKTPEPTLLAALIGFGVLVVGVRRRWVEPRTMSMFMLLGIPAAVCFASVSLQGGFNHHHRYVLQIYPFLFDLDYFGSNGDLFGLPDAWPPRLPKFASIDEARSDEVQWWIISVKQLYNLPGEDGLEYLQQIEPVDKIAYAYHVYRIDPRPIKRDDGTVPAIEATTSQVEAGD